MSRRMLASHSIGLSFNTPPSGPSSRTSASGIHFSRPKVLSFRTVRACKQADSQDSASLPPYFWSLLWFRAVLSGFGAVLPCCVCWGIWGRFHLSLGVGIRHIVVHNQKLQVFVRQNNSAASTPDEYEKICCVCSSFSVQGPHGSTVKGFGLEMPSLALGRKI